MLKIRTLIIALVFAPLISLSLQLTNQAQTNSPSKGTAGSESGGGNTGSNNNPVSSPSKGVAGSASGATPNIIVTKAADGSVSINLSPMAVRELQVVVDRLISSGSLSIFLPINTNRLEISLIFNGLPSQLAKDLTGAASEIVQFSRTSSLPSLELPQARLVASIKAAKADSTSNEANELVTVNANKLNETINIYNKIVLESDPATLQKLSRNSNFVEIGKTLTTLRSAIN